VVCEPQTKGEGQLSMVCVPQTKEKKGYNPQTSQISLQTSQKSFYNKKPNYVCNLNQINQLTMNSKSLFKTIAIIIAVSSFIMSCSKLLSDPATEKTMAIDAIKSEMYRIDIANITFQGLSKADIDLNTCKTGEFSEIQGSIITRDTPNKTITIDFGTGLKGTLSNHTFAGKVVIKHNGKSQTEAGFEATTDIANLTIDGAKFETGDFLQVRTKEATTEKVTWTMDGKLKATLSAGGFISEDVTGDISTGMTLVQDKGVSTPDVSSDDNFIMDGSVTGVASNSKTYTLKINQVTKTPSCKYPTLGSFDFSNSGNLEKIDFAAGGACDSKVKMVYSGISLEFSVN
jgi:hypothetical protein